MNLQNHWVDSPLQGNSRPNKSPVLDNPRHEDGACRRVKIDSGACLALGRPYDLRNHLRLTGENFRWVGSANTCNQSFSVNRR